MSGAILINYLPLFLLILFLFFCFPSTHADDGHNNNNNQAKNGSCGLQDFSPYSSRIIGGSYASPGSWPWAVVIWHRPDRDAFCGATIIREQWLLTAAHCLTDEMPQDVMIRAGVININSTMMDKQRTGSSYEIEDYYFPTKYPTTFENDIALIKLRTKIQFDNYMRAACLPEEIDDFVGHTCWLVGFGQNSVARELMSTRLKQAKTTIIPEDVCKAIGGINVLYYVDYENYHYCLASNSSIACNGDSGSGVYCQKEDGAYYVAGVTSWGDPQCRIPRPTVLTAVPKYRKWIDETISKH